MKNTLFILLAAFALQGFAQSENPIGIYRETSLTTKDGSIMKSPFDQYKVCRTDGNYMLNVESEASTPFNGGQRTSDFVFAQIKSVPLLYTGADGSSDLRIFDSNRKKFTLQWFSRISGHAYFPDHNWCNEYYVANSFSPLGKRIFSLLSSADKTSEKNPFIGTWHRLDMENFKKDMYKVYGEKELLIIWGFGADAIASRGEYGYNSAAGYIWSVKYDKADPTLLYENGGHVLITWVNQDLFVLTYHSKVNNSIVSERWERSTLPALIKIP